MLTRPGSRPGPRWMRKLNDSASAPTAARHLAWLIPLVMFLSVGLSRTLLRFPNQPYESPNQLAGLPLVAAGATPHAIIAIGGRPVGVIAIGGIAMGVVALGGIAIGGIAISGLSLGIIALGGGAVGWLAMGGGALGRYAFGGLAVGSYAYAGGGIALGHHEASGRQKERLFE